MEGHTPLIQNQLLTALSKADYQHLGPSLKRVTVSLGEVLHPAEKEIKYVYFPETCVVSIVATMEDGWTSEIGIVGREGMLGIRVLLGVKKTPHAAVVQVAGSAMRMPSNLLRQKITVVGNSLSTLLLPYTQALMTQLSQSVACVARHSISQRLARWLLAMRDRTGSEKLILTHEIISYMMGVRRSSISVALGELETAGLITGGRGRVIIIDTQGLERIACECYRVVKEEFDRLYRIRPVPQLDS